MSRAELKSWATTLWEGLCQGLCQSGALMAMQNGLQPGLPEAHRALARSQANTGVSA